MGLEMRVKRAILRELARRYQSGRKKEKTRVLEESIGLTGYNRSYGSWLLCNCGREVVLSGGDGQRVVFIGEVRPIRRRRVRVYDEEFKTPYQSLLESPALSSQQKSRLRRTYQELNVVKLKAEIDRLKERLWRLQKVKKNCPNFRIDSYVRQ
ncbi:MAG: hypothetical protein QXQ53_09190 [Candidatus Methanosuratincola sp.]